MKTLLIIILAIHIFFTSISFAGQCELIKLDVDFIREHKDSNTIYLNKNERKKYRIRVNYKGQILDSRGRILDTRLLPNGTAMFVYSKDGIIYLSTKRSITKFTHSSLVAGEDVVVAGMMNIERGRVNFINDVSPRYVTKKEGNLKAALYRLKVMGVDTSKTRLFFQFNY